MARLWQFLYLPLDFEYCAIFLLLYFEKEFLTKTFKIAVLFLLFLLNVFDDNYIFFDKIVRWRSNEYA